MPEPRTLTRRASLHWFAAGIASVLFPSCALVPDIKHKERFHNPFPQLYKVAILPFYNLSREPTVDGDSLAIAYYNELQAIPGFEIMPVGVAKQYLQAVGREPRSGSEFQKLAQAMGVDVVLIGSVSEYSPYYPPRIGLSVDWYAANPGFHPVPVGYGLPWGTPEEEYIPEDLVDQAEFALAREQLATQTPQALPRALGVEPASGVKVVQAQQGVKTSPELLPPAFTQFESFPPGPAAPSLPATWPDPRGFVPAPPCMERPPLLPQTRPVISHTRLYDGKDPDFTAQLEHYFYLQDDARFGGYQGYLQRPDDFVRFCCRLHATETLAARGGAGKSRVNVRWPIGRYER